MEPIVSLTPEVSEDPLSALTIPPKGASVVEIRADLFPDLDLAAAAAACPLPILITIRSAAEGGLGPDDPHLRAAMLQAARNSGAALIDIEFARDLEAITGLGLPPEQIVLSWHDHSGTPEDLLSVTRSMLEVPARHVKVVPTSDDLEDVARILDLAGSIGRERHRLIAFSMGTVGMATRYLAPLLGSPATFAAWNDASPAAPGQVGVRKLMATVGHLHGPPKRLYGVVGKDVSGSLSPELHAAAYRSLDLPYLFIPINVPDPSQLPLLFTAAGETVFDQIGAPAAGWAVTTPYKDVAREAATLVAPRVERSMAANTLILRPDGLIADNTDADGVVGSLISAGVDPVGKPAVVQGTGGAARGAAVGLDLAGANPALRGRSADHSREVAEAMGVASIDGGMAADDGAILVNATPLGSLYDDPSPFTDDEIARAVAVVDMVYAQHRPALEEQAHAVSVPYLDGRTVLAHQGFAQFAAFTGHLPPKKEMLEAIQIAEDDQR